MESKNTALEMAASIVAAYVGNNTVPQSDLPRLITDVYRALVAAAAVYALPRYGALATEGLVALFGLVSLVIIFALRSPEPPAETTATELAPAHLPPLPEFQMPAKSEDVETLEQSRYL